MDEKDFFLFDQIKDAGCDYQCRKSFYEFENRNESHK
jgi:hypothetical protein